ncbi:MAG: hypothetical protein V4543_06825 [Bacteroidota bacterium]
MIKKTQFIFDASGKKTGVMMPIKTYNKILDRIEDLEDLLAIAEYQLNPSDTVSANEVHAKLDARLEKEAAEKSKTYEAA